MIEKDENHPPLIDEHFKPRVAADVEISFFNTDERGDFFLVRNPRDKRYVKVHETGKKLMDSMDGSTTLGALQGTTDIDVYRFTDILAKGGFLSDVPVRKKEEPFYTIKIPLFRTNKPIFTRMYRFFSFVNTTPFKVFYALFVGSGVVLFLLHLGEAYNCVVTNLYLTVGMEPLLLMALIFYVVEIAHEFAHTGASYNNGAEPGDVGLVFHFLVGFFYVETPDTRILSTRANLETFLAGPLTSLLAGAVCTYIFVFTDYYPLVWGASAFFWHMSCLITLTPFMQTDGYYIAQNLLKFPNMFAHSINFLMLTLSRCFHFISKEEYTKAVKGYTPRELRTMKLFDLFMPIQIALLMYFFFFTAAKANILYVFQIAPLILSGNHPYGFKAYFLLFSYSFSLMLLSYASFMTLYKFLKKRGKERW